MRLGFRFIIVAMVAVFMAWSLSFLPEIKSRQRIDHNELQVFNANHLVTLTENNIVDWILTVTIQHELIRVDWSDHILSIDVKVGTPVESKETIYNQILEFVYNGLGGTTNVNRVWVRLVQIQAGVELQPKRLLLALDAHRA